MVENARIPAAGGLEQAWDRAVKEHPGGQVGLGYDVLDEMARLAQSIERRSSGLAGLAAHVLSPRGDENERTLVGLGYVASMARESGYEITAASLQRAAERWEIDSVEGRVNRFDARQAYGAAMADYPNGLVFAGRLEEWNVRDRIAAAEKGWRGQDAGERAAALDAGLARLIEESDPARNPKGYQLGRVMAGWMAEGLDVSKGGLDKAPERLEEARLVGEAAWLQTKMMGATEASARAAFVDRFRDDPMMLGFLAAAEGRVAVSEADRSDRWAARPSRSVVAAGRVEVDGKSVSNDGGLHVRGRLTDAEGRVTPFRASGKAADLISRFSGKEIELFGTMNPERAGTRAKGTSFEDVLTVVSARSDRLAAKEEPVAARSVKGGEAR